MMTSGPSSPLYRRVLLKVSGEALMGKAGYGLDVEVLERLVQDLKSLKALDVQICLVVGGGNIFRGLSGASKGMDRVSADYMGMLATVMNALALQSSCEKADLPARVLSAISMSPVCESYEPLKARQYLSAGNIVIFAAGTGDPFFTTDTAAALRASEMKCDVILKGTKVDGVYSDDPKKNPSAVRYEALTYEDVLAKKLKVMDATAISLASENKIPILVFSMNTNKAFENVVLGKGLFTRIG
ncbi:MAG TPA: UMP kinase [Alphaproteobacteria bacterium]|nr:UMP kinase [Alphaproteobacteria bacterium]HQS94529.1 UMP kinase [Alphaproteobacteria bacterium]